MLLDTSVEPGEQITLFLRGTDSVQLWQPMIKNKRRYLKREQNSNQFLEIKLPIVSFDSTNTPKAKTAFPFTITLPEDLPQSVAGLSQKIKALSGSVRYCLVAMLASHGDEKIVVQTEVQVVRPVVFQGKAEFADECKVGGYFGFGMQNTRSELSVGNSCFAPGEQIPLELGFNNAQSRHSIDCFKFKLFRRITYQLSGKQKVTCEYLNYEKIPGIKKGE